MNATKFVVILFIGVLCAKVGARKLEEVSKDTELNLSVPKATAKGVGAELDTTVITYANSYGSGYVAASQGPKRPSITSVGTGSANTGGTVVANGPNSAANSDSRAAASGGANAGVSRNGASGGAGGGGTARTIARGRTGKN